MAEKGARTQLEAVARQRYVDGKSLTEIEAELGVSRQTLSTWKGQTRKPNEDKDEWDKARERKSSFGIRMEALLERELTFAEGREAGAIDGGILDNLSKLGALVVRFKEIEAQKGKVDKPAMFMEDMEFVAGYLKEKDPEGLKVLAKNFDGLIEAFKEKHAQAA
jgi:transcriptional regulator with XRE-family HTH domain